MYLHKRIAFLEQAIELVFDQHQLKGIHLLHTLNQQEVESNMEAWENDDRAVVTRNQSQCLRIAITATP